MSRAIQANPRFTDPEVEAVFVAYPASVRRHMLRLRELVFATGAETEDAGTVSEALRWGEPSYSTKVGSPVRMDWKSKTPRQYALYFNCQTRLVDTFRELYPAQLRFEGNRAIVFGVGDLIPTAEVRHCLTLALTYQRRKHLPLLGA